MRRTIAKQVQYEFHRFRKQLFVIDKVLIALTILAFGFFRADRVVVVAYVIALFHIFITKRLALLYHLLLSTGMALALVWIIRDEYGYNHDFNTLFGLNAFSLFAWATGLFALALVFTHFEHLLKRPAPWKRVTFFTLLYWPLLIVAETVGYYTFNIHNVATAAYPGLPICDCMHAPWWMQLAYFAMGPIYIIIATILRIKNPHWRIRR